MKVLIAADASPLDDGSGAERVLQEHARELARREHEVRLLYRDSADTSYDGAEWEGCRLFPYAIDRRSNISFLRTTLRNGGRAAARATSDWAPEIINIQQPFTGFALLRAINPPLPPVFYTFLSPAPAEFIRLGGSKPGTRRSLVTRAIQRVENYVLSRADRISVLSAFMENEIQRWHPELDPRQIVRVPGGVDTARFAPLADRRGVRVRLGYPPDNKLLLTVRNLEPRTGVDTLVEAIGELARGRRDFLLLIAGRGPLREQLDRRVEQLEIGDLVRFLGFVPEEELVELYGIADAYIQPDTDLQGFGLPIVEAMACGTPVLATPIGGAIDILAPIDERLLFSSVEPETIASELDRALDDADVMGARARYRAAAEETYSWPRIVDRLEQAFEQLVREDA